MQNCASCGAVAAPDQVKCAYCGARLASVSCPGCFGLIPRGANHCPHCGASAARAERSAELPLPCPRCGDTLASGEVGGIALSDCPACGGIWVDEASFRAICDSASELPSGLGAAAIAAPRVGTGTSETVRYVRCPRCRTLMDRLNFARCSGVIVDVCREHGTWFDHDELRRIVHFLREGGMDLARRRQDRTHEETMRLSAQTRAMRVGADPDMIDGGDVLDSIRAAGRLLGWLGRRRGRGA